MKTTIIALSGPVGCGKSTLARHLQEHLGAIHIKTNELIEVLDPDVAKSRGALQAAGDRLDTDTAGEWVAEGVRAQLEKKPQGSVRFVVVDAIRIASQLTYLRRYFPAAFVHVHLTAELQTLRERYHNRPAKFAEAATYDDVRTNPTERNVGDLAKLADAVINTTQSTIADVFARVVARLGRRPAIANPCVDVLVGGQYGSEGKGNIAHFLAPEYDVLVRVGGPNAGHTVFRVDDDPYIFKHIPSGAISNPGARLVIGAGAVIRLKTLQEEINELSLDVGRLLIDNKAMIIEDSDIAWEEEHLKNEIGSTAQGVGYAAARKISNRWPGSNVRLVENVDELKHYRGDTVGVLADAIMDGRRIMLEGTQGTSLSIHHGPYPHVTSRITTVPGCLAEAGIASRHVRKVIMVCRTYPIRVGNTETGKTSGEMSKEIEFQEIAARSGIPVEELKATEKGSVSKRQRRIAEFDWYQFQRSVFLNGPTDIALTFVDYLDIKNRSAYRYEELTEATLRFVEELEKVGAVPVSLIATGFSERNIIDRRAW